MNPTTDQLPPPPPALPLQPPRSSFSCDRHPDENFTGFCPSCLCERLTTLDQSAINAASSSSRRNSTSTAAAAIKSIFRVPSSSNTTFEAYRNKTTTGTTKTSFFPELRRTKSFSASKNEGLGFSAGVFEPQRKSCDVRNTLWSLFSIDDENKPRLSSAQQQTLGNTGTVLETNKEDEEEEEEDQVNEQSIEISEEQEVVNDSENNIVEEVAEIEQVEEEDVIVDDLKTMKDHIDLDSQSKKPSLSNLWSAASVLSKKWQKWRRKQKKSSNGVLSSSTLPVPKAISRQYRETQSEIADYGFGRRSCDVDPRFSLDAGRISFDDPRYSFDEPRASWDGYMIGRTFPRLPPMVEDVPVVQVQVPRSDMQISVEEPPVNPDEIIPGGSIQTREYYSDSSSKRRKSLDRSNSIRKMAAAVVAEMDEPKAPATAATVSNAKVSPATIDYNYNPGGLRFPSIGGERELLARDSISNSNSLRDDCSETFELGFRDNNGVEKKKGRRWRWKLWGFIHRRKEEEEEEEEDDGFSRVNRSYSEREGSGNRKVFRSNSSVSWRNSSKKLNPETNGFGNGIGNGNGNGKNRRTGGDEFVLERNRSARYSPNHTDSGLLRFYLTPLRGSRRSGIGIGTGTGKTRPISSNSQSNGKGGGWKLKP